MERKKNYNTKNRNCILDFLKQNASKSVSIQDIINYLEEQEVAVNRTTVYRYLNQLCADQMVMKYTDNDEGKTLFQFIGESHHCHEHLHMKCVCCNKVLHMECCFMDEVRKHLQAEHNFTLQCEGSVLYGICDECKKKSADNL